MSGPGIVISRLGEQRAGVIARLQAERAPAVMRMDIIFSRLRKAVSARD
jgi:hypothetical protein